MPGRGRRSGDGVTGCEVQDHHHCERDHSRDGDEVKCDTQLVAAQVRRRPEATRATATPPMMAMPARMRRRLGASPMKRTPPAAAIAGTVSWTMAARVRVSAGKTAYQMA